MVIIAVFSTITEVKKSGKPVVFRTFGGDKRDRTANLLNAMASLMYTNEYNPSISSK